MRDPYRWLEDGDAESVRLWTEAQGRHTREHLDALPGREQIRARLSALFSIGTLTPPSVHRGRYFHVRREGDQQQPLLYVRDEMRGADRVLVDPSGLSPDAATALDWWYPSPHGALLAYGLSEAGSEKSVLRVKDVTDGRVRDDVIPWTRAASPEWLPDASGFYYTRYPEPASVPAGEENVCHRRGGRRRALRRTGARRASLPAHEPRRAALPSSRRRPSRPGAGVLEGADPRGAGRAGKRCRRRKHDPRVVAQGRLVALDAPRPRRAAAA